MTHAIIYSPSNFDSCLATVIMRMILEKQEVKHKTFVYNRGSGYFDTPSYFNNVHILGADLSADDMLGLIEACPEAVFNVYNYGSSTVYPERMLSIIAESHRFKEIIEQGVDGFKMSVSSRVCSQLDDDIIGYIENKGSNTVSLIKDYAGVTSLYMNFLPMTAAQTLFLFSNMNNVKRSAAGQDTLLLEDGSTASQKKQYDDYVQDVRQMVRTNMSMAYYPGANGSGFQTPTICVGERDAMHAMRFINYAHDEVISYEDIRSARIYRILSKSNLQWYIKRFEPRDIWFEGHLTYLKTDLVQHVR